MTRLSYLFIILLFITGFTSCSSRKPALTSGRYDAVNRHYHLRQGTETTQTSVNQNRATKPNGPCQFERPDTSVYGIILNDFRSAERTLGNKILLDRTSGDLPFAQFVSGDKKQKLTLYFHPGSTMNEFAEFQVEYASNSSLKLLETPEFITGCGIRLGMSKTEVTKILGTCSEITINGTNETLTYRITDFKKSEFLKRYNYPSYYAKYEFRKDRLERFRFGFEYP